MCPLLGCSPPDEVWRNPLAPQRRNQEILHGRNGSWAKFSGFLKCLDGEFRSSGSDVPSIRARDLQQGGGQKAGSLPLVWGCNDLMSKGLLPPPLSSSSPKCELPWARGGIAELLFAGRIPQIGAVLVKPPAAVPISLLVLTVLGEDLGSISSSLCGCDPKAEIPQTRAHLKEGVFGVRAPCGVCRGRGARLGPGGAHLHLQKCTRLSLCGF